MGPLEFCTQCVPLILSLRYFTSGSAEAQGLAVGKQAPPGDPLTCGVDRVLPFSRSSLFPREDGRQKVRACRVTAQATAGLGGVAEEQQTCDVKIGDAN